MLWQHFYIQEARSHMFQQTLRVPLMLDWVKPLISYSQQGILYITLMVSQFSSLSEDITIRVYVLSCSKNTFYVLSPNCTLTKVCSAPVCCNWWEAIPQKPPLSGPLQPQHEGTLSRHLSGKSLYRSASFLNWFWWRTVKGLRFYPAL